MYKNPQSTTARQINKFQKKKKDKNLVIFAHGRELNSWFNSLADDHREMAEIGTCTKKKQSYSVAVTLMLPIIEYRSNKIKNKSAVWREQNWKDGVASKKKWRVKYKDAK